eukprot:CAMPEP_0183728902 /NCGR_PEP_ID=MMETSP0737-20130205/29209_1 /TAXON_ID=385413 /ORGANISM="Thalassiosira miniscula, Strain CCMP1093" /LENGTH=53 /DNA_ID=CAMNT_0025960971 /DNA_START=121 /DNA_END=282 /DNA_ORIENTATION=-
MDKYWEEVTLEFTKDVESINTATIMEESSGQLVESNRVIFVSMVVGAVVMIWN